MPLTPERISQLRQIFPSSVGDLIDRLILQNGNSALVADFVDRLARLFNADSPEYDIVGFESKLELFASNLSSTIAQAGYTGSNEGVTLADAINDILENTKAVVEKTGDFANGYQNGALLNLPVLYAPDIGFASAANTQTLASPLIMDVDWQKPQYFKMIDGVETAIAGYEDGAYPKFDGNGNVILKNNGAGMNFDKNSNPQVVLTSANQMFQNTKGLSNVDLYVSSNITLNQTFNGSNIRSFVFDGKDTHLLQQTFWNCLNLRAVFNIDSASNKFPHWAETPFLNCGNLTEWTFSKNILANETDTEGKIYWAFATTNTLKGYGNGFPGNLSVESIKRYLRALYDWNTDREGLLTNPNLPYANGHTLSEYWENGTDAANYHDWAFVGLYNGKLGGGSGSYSLLRRAMIVTSNKNVLRADSEADYYAQLVIDKGWEPLW
jgi:hypothetical protein